MPTVIPGSSFPFYGKPSPAFFLRIPVFLFCLFCTGFVSLHAQQQVAGNVTTTESRKPLEGVTVTQRGTPVSVVTDKEGNYRITLTRSDAILVFSYTGYKTIQQRINERQTINVVMEPDIKDLDDVVVVGYGRIRKSDLTGSVSKIKVKDANETPALSVDQFLQGRVSGVQITQNTGAPGSGVTFLVRGAGSVTGSTQPLIILDGYPIENSSSLASPVTGANGWTADMPPSNPLANLNPNDIESIEVLKDASAISIYGSRGANGVVLITTKRGQAGREKITLSTRFDLSRMRKTIDVLNTAEYIAFANEANLNSGLDSAFRQAQIANFQGRDFNWQDLVYRQALSQDYQATVSGGVDKFRYLLALNYTRAEGIVQNSGYNRGSVRLNIDREINNRIRFGFNTNAVMSTNNLITQAHSNGASSGSVVIGSLFYRPMDIPYNNDDPNEINTDLQGNPLTLINRLTDQTQTRTLILNAFGEYKISDYLTFRLNAGANSIQSTREAYHPRGTNIGDANQGLANRIESSNFNYLSEYTLSYIRKAGKHSINAVGGYTWQAWNTKSIGVTATNFPNDNLGFNNFQIASNAQVPVSSNVSWALASVLGRINYVFDNRYLLTLTGRMDGSTRLAENNKWAFFPSVAVGWNLHNEAFMKNQDLFHELKLRASYGQSGNQAIAVGATQSTLTPIRRPFAGGIFTALTLGSFENPDLHWETTSQFNAGIEMAFLRNRLKVGVDYYNRNTRDLLLNLTLPGSAGFSSYAANSGEISNKGFEIEADAKIIDKKIFKWSANGNISFNHNKVIHLGKTGQIFGTTFLQSGNLQMNSPVHIVRPGHPIGAFYGYKIIGIYQNQAEIDHGPADPVNPKPGDFKFADVNGDGEISLADMTIIGNPYPKFTFGLSNELQYRNFSLSVLFTGNIGQDVVNLNRYQLDGLYAGFNLNVSREAYLNRWTGEGTSNRYPRPTSAGISFRQRFSDFLVEKASFIRLRTLTLAYNVPVRNVKGIRGAKIFVSGNNLLTFTDYSGYDPEINAKGNNSMTPGVDFGAIPQVRTLSAGLTLNF